MKIEILTLFLGGGVLVSFAQYCKNNPNTLKKIKSWYMEESPKYLGSFFIGIFIGFIISHHQPNLIKDRISELLIGVLILSIVIQIIFLLILYILTKIHKMFDK